jgi:hypothetical protein
MSHNRFEDLSNKLARDVDSDHKIDGSMFLRHELSSNPQEALALIHQEQQRELRTGSCERVEIKPNGEIFITNYRPASGIHSEGVYVGMYPGAPEPSAQRPYSPPAQQYEAPPPPPPQQSFVQPRYDQQYAPQQFPPPAQPYEQTYAPPPPAPPPQYEQTYVPQAPMPQQYYGPPPVAPPMYAPSWYQPQPSISLWFGNGGGRYHNYGGWHRR